MKKFMIFDLDGTLIDSSHRYSSLPNGDIDLPAWIRDNTPENVAKDKLLPLGQVVKSRMKKGDFALAGETAIACTARVFNAWDWEYLKEHGLDFSAVLHRYEGNGMGDADLKEMLLRDYAQRQGIVWKEFCARAVLFEDNLTVIERADQLGISTFHAPTWHQVVQAKQA